MNRKGFTLVELLVSIVILAVIMVFISTFLLNLGNQKDDAQLDLNLLVNQSSISKILNTDASIYGIQSVECVSNKKCNITFKSGESLNKTIEIVDNNKSIKYYDSDKVYMVRTLEGNREFSTISKNLISFDSPVAYFYEITIGFANSDDYDIKVYDYRLAGNNLRSITVNPNNGTSSYQIDSLEAGATYDLNRLTLPTKQGYVFEEWSTNSPSVISGTIFTMGNTNATITAQWDPITYSVAYNGNGSTSGGMSPSTHTYDSAKALTSNGFAKTGSNFTGWATSANGDVVYQNGDSVTNLSTINGATVNLYAQWSTSSYTITLDNQSATTAGSASVSATYGNAIPNITPPTKTNYSFGGYYTGTNGTGTQYITASGTSARNWDIATNTVLYAKWNVNQFAIDVNPIIDGTYYYSGLAGHTFNVYVNDVLNASSVIDWYQAVDYGSTVRVQANAVTGKTTTYDQTVTVTANGSMNPSWTTNSYNIAINCNAGTYGAWNHTCTYGQSVTIANVVDPANCGYSVSSSMVKIATSWATATYTCTGNTTIGANWSNLFSYNGSYSLTGDASNWTIEFYSGGTFTLYRSMNIDIHAIGGGGAGGNTALKNYGAGGGAGGRASTVKNASAGATSYTVTIGTGGTVASSSSGDGGPGGTSSFGSLCSAIGGTGGLQSVRWKGGAGGTGGSGGGGGASGALTGGEGGKNGASGSNGNGTASGAGGSGLGGVSDFGEGSIYRAGGGGGGGGTSGSASQGGGIGGNGATAGGKGTDYYGGGGGGGGGNGTNYSKGGAGGCGIVIIRNAR